MRLRALVLALAVGTAGCRTVYRVHTSDVTDLEALQARDATLPATYFEDGEDRRLSLHARSIVEVGADYGNEQCRVEARDGRTPLAVGLVVAGIGLFSTVVVAGSHPERMFLGELNYLPAVGLVVTGGVVAAVGAALGNPEVE